MQPRWLTIVLIVATSAGVGGLCGFATSSAVARGEAKYPLLLAPSAKADVIPLSPSSATPVRLPVRVAASNVAGTTAGDFAPAGYDPTVSAAGTAGAAGNKAPAGGGSGTAAAGAQTQRAPAPTTGAMASGYAPRAGAAGNAPQGPYYAPRQGFAPRQGAAAGGSTNRPAQAGQNNAGAGVAGGAGAPLRPAPRNPVTWGAYGGYQPYGGFAGGPVPPQYFGPSPTMGGSPYRPQGSAPSNMPRQPSTAARSPASPAPTVQPGAPRPAANPTPAPARQPVQRPAGQPRRMAQPNYRAAPWPPAWPGYGYRRPPAYRQPAAVPMWPPYPYPYAPGNWPPAPRQQQQRSAPATPPAAVQPQARREPARQIRQQPNYGARQWAPQNTAGQFATPNYPALQGSTQTPPQWGRPAPNGAPVWPNAGTAQPQRQRQGGWAPTAPAGAGQAYSAPRRYGATNGAPAQGQGDTGRDWRAMAQPSPQGWPVSPAPRGGVSNQAYGAAPAWPTQPRQPLQNRQPRQAPGTSAGSSKARQPQGDAATGPVNRQPGAYQPQWPAYPPQGWVQPQPAQGAGQTRQPYGRYAAPNSATWGGVVPGYGAAPAPAGQANRQGGQRVQGQQ